MKHVLARRNPADAAVKAVMVVAAMAVDMAEATAEVGIKPRSQL